MKVNIVIVVLLSLVLTAFGETPLEIAMKADLVASGKSDNETPGWGDLSADVKMVLISRSGDERTREIRIFKLQVPGDSDDSLIIFDLPSYEARTAIWTSAHRDKDDVQWVYLPLDGRSKRIPTANMSGLWANTEFSYEDLVDQEVDEYTYGSQPDAVLDGVNCFVIVRFPVNEKNSGYVRQVLWIDKDEYLVRRIDYYGKSKKDKLLKTLTITGYQKRDGKYWQPDVVHMQNQNGRATTLIWSGYKFSQGLTFDKNNLTRAQQAPTRREKR